MFYLVLVLNRCRFFPVFCIVKQGVKRWRIFDTSTAVPRWPVLDAGMSDRGKAGDVLYLEQAEATNIQPIGSQVDVR